MKAKICCFIFMLLFFSFSFSICSFGQLIVDAGKDTTYCTGVGKMYLGRNVTIKNGVEPYSIGWECKVKLNENLIFTAKDFLNDTTLLSPLIIDHISWPEWIKFIIHVRDSKNSYARDSINVRFSSFSYLLGYVVEQVKKGDSVLFKYSSVGGGIEPLKFHWQPTIGLSNPDTLVTWCKTDSLTKFRNEYQIVAIDSCGCVSSPNLMYEIWVMQTVFNELKENKTNLLHIKQEGATIYFHNPLKQKAHVALYTINGILSQSIDIADDHFDISSQIKNKGVYLIKIDLGGQTGISKLINF